jgi:hypothetical protein
MSASLICTHEKQASNKTATPNNNGGVQVVAVGYGVLVLI